MSGYPMTFQRFLNRNGLKDGGYRGVPIRWATHCDYRPYVPDAFTPQMRDLLDRANEERQAIRARVRTLAGDLRRLEEDAVDENGICKYISGRLQLPDETVAAVLKEFMAW